MIIHSSIYGSRFLPQSGFLRAMWSSQFTGPIASSWKSVLVHHHQCACLFHCQPPNQHQGPNKIHPPPAAIYCLPLNMIVPTKVHNQGLPGSAFGCALSTLVPKIHVTIHKFSVNDLLSDVILTQLSAPYTRTGLKPLLYTVSFVWKLISRLLTINLFTIYSWLAVQIALWIYWEIFTNNSAQIWEPTFITPVLSWLIHISHLLKGGIKPF